VATPSNPLTRPPLVVSKALLAPPTTQDHPQFLLSSVLPGSLFASLAGAIAQCLSPHSPPSTAGASGDPEARLGPASGPSGWPGGEPRPRTTSAGHPSASAILLAPLRRSPKWLKGYPRSGAGCAPALTPTQEGIRGLEAG
jgi:hypothetical protein